MFPLHLANLSLALHRLQLPFRVLANRPTAPQLASHQGVADDHHQHREAVGDDQKDHVVAEQQEKVISLIYLEVGEGFVQEGGSFQQRKET